MIGLLLSGGMDSTCIAWWKRPDVAITVDYGQRAAEGEIHAAQAVCNTIGIRHEIIRVDCSSLGSGDMAGGAAMTIAPVSEWWPYRNQLIITLAASLAVGLGVGELMIGALATDCAHADGRPEFIEAISLLMELQEGGLVVSAPAITLDAVGLVRESDIPQGILAWAHSCHIASLACGRCRGCAKHYRTWKELGWHAH
jgi:7-cyano-7-deazaguanine synthase